MEIKEELKEEDVLNRLPIIKNLTNILENIGLEEGCVLGIDASWGKGKTTFINRWENYLKTEKEDKYNIIKINSWENDDCNNAFLSLVIELEEIFKKNAQQSNLENFLKCVDKISLIKASGKLVNNLVGVLSHGVIKIDELIKETYSPIKEEKERRELKKEIKKLIGSLAIDKKLIFFIDELDRCRPLYAIEFLEVIKHFFNVKNCIFIIAWDKQQLSESIKTIYGQGMDSTGYLRRFIDLDYLLPNPSIETYIKYLTEKDDIFEKAGNYFKEFICQVCEVYNLTLRDIDKLILMIKLHVSIKERRKFDNNRMFIYNLLKSIFFSIKMKNLTLYKKIKEFSYDKTEIDNILKELKVQELEERIKDKDFPTKDIVDILRKFLEVNINKEEMNESYYIYRVMSNINPTISLKNFCTKDYLFNEIEFLENIDSFK